MSKIDRDINESMLRPRPVVEPRPSAWELRVRRSDTEWRRYSIYESHKQAVATMKRVEGQPLELKIVPLYAAEEEP